MNERVLSPEEVSPQTIKAIFDDAYITATLTPDDKVCVTEGGIKIFISVEEDKQLLTYFLLFGWRSGTLFQDQLEFTNALNQNVVFLRAWAFPEGIVLDYSLPYDGGLLPQQVLSAYQWLRRTAIWGIQQYDQKHLVA
ncbi:MAG: YbjN domain-containing protein [Anaerolineae bacterium]|nr:YbjN domain-containing protein [Anaerolineae bacterium]MDW8067813.1 YbjN domain-containing protein [Anaerolineae bacterium]